MVAMPVRWWRWYSLTVTAFLAYSWATSWYLASKALEQWPDDRV